MALPEFSTRVAGVSHYQDAVRACHVGDKVTLTPEPENPHDTNAVRVDGPYGKMGYIPRDTAPTVAAQIDRIVDAEIISMGTPKRVDVVGVFLTVRYTPKELQEGIDKAYEQAVVRPVEEALEEPGFWAWLRRAITR